MGKLNHLQIAVKDCRASRDWYIEHMGMKLEFEARRRRVAGLQDDLGITLILEQVEGEIDPGSCILAFEVDDVEAKYEELFANGVRFVHAPKKVWGYGAELKDPNGYRVRLWDERTMNEKG